MIEGDSGDYELITTAINCIPKDLPGIACEIGIRRGLGCKYIIDAVEGRLVHTPVMGIDCYGNLPYAFKENLWVGMDYTNEMRNETIGELYQYAGAKGINFIFINLTDTEFFKRFADGIPIYSETETIVNEYIFAHLDGPHQSDALLKEFNWLNERMQSGATIVFDDVSFYDFDKVHKHVLSNNWRTLNLSSIKISYQKF